MCFFILVFQVSNGTLVFIYVNEVVCEAATGLCLMTLMGMLVVQSLTVESFFNIEGFGVKGVFLSLSIF